MFTDTLELKLTITTGGQSFEIPGGNIKTLKAALHQYGFTCEVSFLVSCEQATDELFSLFVKPDLMNAQLEILAHYNPKNLTLEAMKLTGLVMQKSILTEATVEKINLEGNPILYRHYQVSFADPAFVLWRQHFPCDLMTDKTVKDLLDTHKGSEVSLSYDWDALEKQFAIITLPLGAGLNKASFYDFVLWLVSSLDGVLTYDCNENTYKLSKVKAEDGQAVFLDKQDVADLRLEFPETIRHSANLLNAYSEDPRNDPIAQAQAVSGVRSDFLGRFPVSADFEDRKSLETRKLKVREHELHLTFGNFPLIPFRPGSLIKLAEQGWSQNIMSFGKDYRVRDIFLSAKSAEDEVTLDHNMTYARYTIDMESRLESKTEKWVSLPPFQPPMFPLRVEGKIKSEGGGANEKTYQIYQDQKTSLDQYKVIIPLFASQEVVVLFEPDFLMGHFYFPAYKNARVLVSLNFHSGWIERFLDWGAGARLPLDTQGDHILMGKGKDAKSQTSINHVYVNEKPVLNVKRTSEIDTQMIKLEEGRLVLETKEEE
jgi:hypothetical protein